MNMNKKKKSIITICKLLAFIVFFEFINVYSIELLEQKQVLEDWLWENVYGAVNESKLYSLSACLYDADNERVLYSKEGDEIRAMASTTKIMTCIIALENGNLDDIVDVSKYAASMPNVKLGVITGEKYRLGDLLYSLMLESHNDVAVVIAEHISGSVEEFANLMNQKARDLQCNNTYFITPNGLDATKEVNGVTKTHSTTAEELCKIMSYCIKNEQFLEITRTNNYSFTNKKVSENGEISNGGRSFTVFNKNKFLTMMEGALSGKTGFTGNAGYCYVGALRRDGKTFIVALLGCGWPNNKGYKWKDTTYLMEYGLQNYENMVINDSSIEVPDVIVHNGTRGDERGDIKIIPKVIEQEFELLLCDEDKVTVEINISEELEAPVKKSDIIGNITYKVNDIEIGNEIIVANDDVGEYEIEWCFSRIINMFFLN